MVYAPGTQEKDLTKLNMSLQQNAAQNATNATNIAANTAAIAALPSPPSAATKSDQQTGTSSTVFVSPLHQQDHDSAAKAWVYFTVSGTTVTVQASYNVTSVVRNGIADYSVNFTTAFASVNYVAAGSAVNATQNMWAPVPVLASTTASLYRFNTAISSAAGADPTFVSLVFFGRQ